MGRPSARAIPRVTACIPVMARSGCHGTQVASWGAADGVTSPERRIDYSKLTATVQLMPNFQMRLVRRAPIVGTRLLAARALILIVAIVAGSVVLAASASAVTGCAVYANTDFRAYGTCSGGRGQFRAGAACVLRNGWYVRTAYGMWVPAGKPSIADCGAPFQQIDRRAGRPVVWWETRA